MIGIGSSPAAAWRAVASNRNGDVGRGQWLIALALVSAVHALVAGGLSGLEPASVPAAGVRLIEASLLPPAPRLAAAPAEAAESAPPAPEPPVVEVPEPPPPPEPEPEVVKPPPLPEPPPVPAVSPRAVPKTVAKARPRPKPAATTAQRPATITAAAAGGGSGGPPRTAAATAPRQDAAYLKNPPPPYPAQARRRGLEGRVLVHATVAVSGECTGAELRRSSGHAILDEAALRAVRAWRFVPAMRDGRPVVAGVDVPIVFRLED